MILLMNAKPGYVLRTANELDDVMEFARDFDRMKVLAIAGVIQMEFKAIVQSRCFLSRNPRGFGFVRQGGMQSEAGQISSCLLLGSSKPSSSPMNCTMYNQTFIGVRFNWGRTKASRTCTEVGRGDPCGSLFFKLGMQHTLLTLRDKARDLEAEYNLDQPDSPVLRPAKVIAFADDASIVAQPDITFRLAPFIVEIYCCDRLTLNPGKSHITGSTADGKQKSLRLRTFILSQMASSC